MLTDANPLSLSADPEHDPEADALELSAQVTRMIAVIQALVSSQRSVDVQGLQGQIGLLCAKALDLPPARTGFLKLELRQLLSAIDTLSASLREQSA